jgi:hypothetical protein
MATVLHLLKDPDARLARAVIDQPPEVRLRRLETDLSYPELLELIFESDQVITW